MRDVQPIPASQPPERFDDKVYFQALQALSDEEKPGFARWKWMVAAFGVVVLLGMLFVGLRHRMVGPITAPSLTLTLAPAGADVLITWAGGPAHSTSSALHLRDDGHEEHVNLLPGYGVAGTFVYHPKTSHVHVTWSVNTAGRFYGREADYEAQTPVPAPAPLAPVQAPRSPKASSSRSEMERLKAHDRRMEALIKALRAKQQSGPSQ